MEEGFGAFGLDVALTIFEAGSAEEGLPFLPSILQKGSIRQAKMILALLDRHQAENVAFKMIHHLLLQKKVADALLLASYSPCCYATILQCGFNQVKLPWLFGELQKISCPQTVP